MREVISPLHALYRALTSKHRGTTFTNFLKLKPRSCHPVAHRAAHRWESCEICGVVKSKYSDLRMWVATT